MDVYKAKWHNWYLNCTLLISFWTLNLQIVLIIWVTRQKSGIVIICEVVQSMIKYILEIFRKLTVKFTGKLLTSEKAQLN